MLRVTGRRVARSTDERAAPQVEHAAGSFGLRPVVSRMIFRPLICSPNNVSYLTCPGGARPPN